MWMRHLRFEPYQLPEPTTASLCFRWNVPREPILENEGTEENDLRDTNPPEAEAGLKMPGEAGGERVKTRGVWNRVAKGDRGRWAVVLILGK